MTSTNINICGICRDELVSDIKTLTCNHEFHTACIDSWTARVPSCPFCRTIVNCRSIRLLVDDETIETEEQLINVMRTNVFDHSDLVFLHEAFILTSEVLVTVIEEFNIRPDWIVQMIEDRLLDLCGIETVYLNGYITDDDMLGIISRGLITDRRVIKRVAAMMEIRH